MKTRHNTTAFAIAVATVLLAILLYDVTGAIVKHLGRHYPTPQLAMFRNLFGLVPTALILVFSRDWVRAGRPVGIRQWKLALARGGLGAFAQISLYVALTRMELATATTILFAAPFFVTVLSIPVLGHRVGLWRWLSVSVGFIGVLLVVRPTAESFNWNAILPLCATFGFASVSVSARLFDRDVPTALINLYYSVGTLTGAVGLVVFSVSFVPVLDAGDWMWLAAMGVAGGVAAYCLIAAYRRAEPSSLSPFEYFGIPFSFCLGWVFFSEAPFDRLIPGAFLIVAGGLLTIWREHALNRRS